MAFTTEARIRLHAGLNNGDLVTSELIAARLADAHEILLAELDISHHESADARLALAETELASAWILRSLATESGFEDRDLRSGSLVLKTGERVRSLSALADAEEASAWRHARPFLKKRTLSLPLQILKGDSA